MKVFRWSETKNKHLQKERGITFEEILEAIGGGGLLDDLEHPNKRQYRGQRLFVVRCTDYVYLVPYVETEEEIFLKTIIPSRKYQKRYREVS